LFKLITDLKLNSNGTIMVNETFQTSNTKYFAAGDAVSGGEEVVNAVANGKKAALSIAQLLGV
jgi:glutamate synthase (NADPH/NADH) small chain